MKSPRHQFMVLGLVCQGLAWEGWFFVTLYGLLWCVILMQPPGRLHIGKRAEGVVLAIGCVAGYLMGLLPMQTPHFFFGHGLAWLQLARLTRPLDSRERTQCVFVAFLHLGVASTIILDYRYIPLILVALVMIPRMLVELESGEFPATTTAPVRARVGLGACLLIAAVMVTLFAVFPRGLLGTPLQLRRGGPEGTLADAVLDPTLGGLQQSQSILMQVEGKDVGYLRAMVLPDYDGRQWITEAPLIKVRFTPGQQPPDSIAYRQVRVKEARFIDRLLPGDGHVVYARGKFFSWPYLSLQNVVHTGSMWNTGNNYYEYWTVTKPVPERMTAGMRDKFTRHPQASARLKQWLVDRVGGVSDPFQQAVALETYLQTNFTYTLGAPQLRRINPLDDFIFNQREGHCERFASTLALLLRMQDIPSRVVVGYIPGDPNWLTGWRNVRFRDSHAWTEAWFEGRGWVELDATPRATMRLPEPYLADVLNALDVMWYVNIVNFDTGAQKAFFSNAGVWVGRTMESTRDNALWLVSLALMVGFFYWLRKHGWRFPWKPRPARTLSDAQVLAGHYYGELLRALGRQGHRRNASQTPREFLAQLAGAGHPGLPDVARITDFFCASRYGAHIISAEEEKEIQAALGRIKGRKSET